MGERVHGMGVAVQRIHSFDAVMDSVEPPQEGEAMLRPVHPVVHEIVDEQRHQRERHRCQRAQQGCDLRLPERDQRPRHDAGRQQDEQSGPAERVEQGDRDLHGDREAEGAPVGRRSRKPSFDDEKGGEQSRLAGEADQQPEQEQEPRLGERTRPARGPSLEHRGGQQIPLFPLGLLGDGEADAGGEDQEQGRQRRPAPERRPVPRGGLSFRENRRLHTFPVTQGDRSALLDTASPQGKRGCRAALMPWERSASERPGLAFRERGC